MSSGMDKIFGWAKSHLAPAKPAPEPAQLVIKSMPNLVFAVGDVHGCLDLYIALERMIAQKAAAAGGQNLLIVLGDIIDRGPNSAQVIDHFLTPAPDHVTRIVLRGNHEDMFLKFMENPSASHAWLEFGGRETLNSYGFFIDEMQETSLRGARLGQALGMSIPQEHIDFVASLPVAVHLPKYLFSHAGANPSLPVLQQTARDLMWGNPARLDDHPLPVTVVHGHVPIARGESMASEGRINVDTGAYATGVLTAVELSRSGPQSFLIAQNTEIQ